MTDNPIELLVTLGVNEDSSKTNINNQISELSKKLENLKIDINIDDRAVDSLEKLSNLNLDGLNSNIKKAEDSFEGLGRSGKESANQLSDSLGNIGKTVQETERTVSSSAGGMSSEMKKVANEIDLAFAHMSQEFRDNLKRGITDIDQLKSAFDGLDPKFNIEAKNVLDDFGETQKVVQSVAVEYRNMQGHIEKATLSAREFIDLGNGQKMPMFSPVSEEIKVMDDSMRRVGQATTKAEQELKKLEITGKITKEQYNQLSLEARKVTDPKHIGEYNLKVQETLAKNKENARVLKEQEQTQEKIRKTINEIVRMQGKNPQAFANNPEVSGMIKTLEKIDPTAEGASQSVKKVTDNFERMKAEATVAGRETMTFMDSFKVAMEKFPVWMAASTAFYGTVRSIRDAITQIIELDSQMTVLRRVGGDAVDTNKILEESVELAGKLGNQIADINDGFIAFARQGFSGDELGRMAEYATLLGNISELTVEDASSVLTAGLKGFNIEAEDAIRIVDALNEVDNNFSVTTVQLAEAMQRSAGAANTYGVELEKNIGYTTAIAQVTRESGSVVGKNLVAV